MNAQASFLSVEVSLAPAPSALSRGRVGAVTSQSTHPPPRLASAMLVSLPNGAKLAKCSSAVVCTTEMNNNIYGNVYIISGEARVSVYFRRESQPEHEKHFVLISEIFSCLFLKRGDFAFE